VGGEALLFPGIRFLRRDAGFFLGPAGFYARFAHRRVRPGVPGGGACDARRFFFPFSRVPPDKKTNTSDPYVVVKIFGLKKTVKKKKTAVVKHNLNPVWNEKLGFDVSDVRVEALHFTVFDKDMFGSEFMGQLTLTMKVRASAVCCCCFLTYVPQEIAAKNNTIDDWFTLDTNHKGEAVSGELHIKAKLTPPPGQDNLFAAPAVPEQEDTLSGDALKAVLAQEEEFNKGKNTVADIYKVGKELGRGAFAVVKECVHKQSGRKYAVKIIDRNAMGDTNELSLQREIEIMKKVDHPNIILLRQVFEDKKHVYLVMELVTGGELFDKIVEVTICQVSFFFSDSHLFCSAETTRRRTLPS
jgi:hypothetical protein